MKVKVCIIVSLVLVICSVGYLYYDGLVLYKIQKRIISPLKLIEYYSGKKFPEGTVIESMEFEGFDDPYNETFRARLIVPKATIKILFPEKTREYGSFYNSYLTKDELSDIDFRCGRFCVVRRKLYKTQRVINFVIFKSENKTVKLYVSIDKLGFYQLNK